MLVTVEKQEVGPVYQKVLEYKKRYSGGIYWRLRKHAAVIEKHLNPDEEILYAFPAQKNPNVFEFFYTNVIALTNKRIMIATKRVLWGYFFVTITPDMFNDLTVRKGLIFGNLVIDTIKEKVYLSNIDPNALPEIETVITSYMMEKKEQLAQSGHEKEEI